ncbi:MAG: tRNA uridine-5-carboxymethylaminomethyl(34) synthesis GTPase MnmE [Bacteroidota bacterium]
MIFRDPEDTIVALASGEAVSALSLIRISGKNAFSIADALFSKNISGASSHRAYFGDFIIDDKVLDECMLFVFKGPQSFTGEDTVEITCHGSSYIRREMITAILGKGARMAEPGEFSMRAFKNGKMDLSETEAITDLIHSETKQQHAMAMHQMKGGFKKELSGLRQQLIDFASLIELELDFSGEDVEFANREDFFQLLKTLDSKVVGLINSFQQGNVIKNGVFSVIAGRPNAGKSTLLNALLNEERAIVSSIPGTTRDVIEDTLSIGGVKFRLFDTAGIREAQDQVERMGIEKTYASIAKGALLIYVFDQQETGLDKVLADLEKIKFDPGRTLMVANKADVGEMEFDREEVLFISAKEKQGIEDLKAAMLAKSQVGDVNNDALLVSNLRHLKALEDTKESLNEVFLGFERGISSDLVAIDIRRALFHLGEITGEVSSDDLLGNIFANFCIGK